MPLPVTVRLGALTCPFLDHRDRLVELRLPAQVDREPNCGGAVTQALAPQVGVVRVRTDTPPRGLSPHPVRKIERIATELAPEQTQKLSLETEITDFLILTRKYVARANKQQICVNINVKSRGGLETFTLMRYIFLINKQINIIWFNLTVI